MQRVPSRVVVALLGVLLLAIAGPAQAAVSPFWPELGGSASGEGVSGAVSPATVLDASVAVGGDGLPVVAYTEYPDMVSAQGSIMVKHWTGSAWEILSPGGVGQGYAPQVRIAASGAIHVAWLRESGAVKGSISAHLVAAVSSASIRASSASSTAYSASSIASSAKSIAS